MEAEAGKCQLGWSRSAASMGIQSSKGFSLLKEFFWAEIRPCSSGSLKTELQTSSEVQILRGMDYPSLQGQTEKGDLNSLDVGKGEERPGLGGTGENVGLEIPGIAFPSWNH